MCKKCKQTIANCECYIPDKEKYKGLYVLIKDIRNKSIIHNKI